MDHGEFSVGEGRRVLNQTHNPERVESWSVADPFSLGAGKTRKSDRARSTVASRGHRLHRAERIEDEATRRVAASGLRENV